MSDTAFGERYFGGSSDEARMAAMLRDALARHLGRCLDGLRPDDQLWEDLHVDLEVDPHFFWSIEERLGVAIVGQDGVRWLATLRSVRTFRDLLMVVQEAIQTGRTAG